MLLFNSLFINSAKEVMFLSVCFIVSQDYTKNYVTDETW